MHIERQRIAIMMPKLLTLSCGRILASATKATTSSEPSERCRTPVPITMASDSSGLSDKPLSKKHLCTERLQSDSKDLNHRRHNYIGHRSSS
jgi:hypothetical protein